MTLSEFLSASDRALRRLNTDYCLVGGFATSLRGEPRLTRDVDVVITVSDDRQAEEVVNFLKQSLSLKIHSLLEQEKTGRLATVRLISTDSNIEGGFLLDILFSSSGIEKEICLAAEELEVLPGIEMKVARRPHLIAMKLLSVDERLRPRDAEDLLAMLRLSSPEEIDTVRQLIQFIEERGYSRGRNLNEILVDFQSRVAVS